MTLLALTNIGALAAIVVAVAALVYVVQLRKEVQALTADNLKQLIDGKGSSELALLEHIVANQDDWESGFRNFRTQIPRAGAKSKYDTISVTLDLTVGRFNETSFKVIYDGNEFVFPKEEQAAAKKLYEQVAERRRASAMLALAESKGMDLT